MNAKRRQHGLGQILCVDDDSYLTDLLTYALEREGFVARVAHHGMQALQIIEAEPPDAIILDVNLPDVNGFNLCTQIRRNHDIPVIVLSARRAEEDVLAGFSQGADDYLAKPFSMRELVSRLRAVLKRARSDNVRQYILGRKYQIEDATFDAEYNQVTGDAGSVQLTPIEGRILQLLLVNAGQVFQADRIIELVWGYDAESSAAVVKTHIRRLRQKLETVVGDQEVIHTVPGMGYTFRQRLSVVRTTRTDVQLENVLASDTYDDGSAGAGPVAASS
jgi:DNA-binding response OmpR family regulator